MKTFFTWQEDEAYRQGRKDASFGKTDHSRDSRMASEPDTPDRAYWIGQTDYAKEREVRQRDEEYWDEEYERWKNG